MAYYSCLLCGYVLPSSRWEDAKQWLREYRAIYSHPSGYSVTGIGYYDHSINVMPSDPARRWDDHDSGSGLLELPLMQNGPRRGLHGFALHDACWMLLRKAWGPEEIRIDRLVEMCESIPYPLYITGLGWQHCYGGLIFLDTQNYFPWQEILTNSSDPTQLVWDAMENPYDVPIMPSILSCSRPQPVRGMEKTAHDCFSRLPWELCEAIAVLLTTEDALALREACTSFLPLLSSSTFWASRFAGDRERGFVFEMHGRRGPTDWLELYRLTSQKSGPSGLRNRCRVWYIIKLLIEISRLELNGGLTSTTSQQAIAPPRFQVTGDLNFSRRFEEGCCSLRTIVVAVPELLLRIGVSTINFSSTSYVTGLRFIARSTSDICIGYISSRETFITLQEFFGFKVAVAPSGLRALQIVGKNSHLSQWLGCPSDFPVSERLIRSQPIESVTVRLDAFKIVGLGVTTLDVIPDQDLETDLPMRETAIWYPSKPPNELYLNESSFVGQNPCHVNYRPLFWNHFGGKRGSNLKNIVGLVVRSKRCLEFMYDGTCGHSSSKLGRSNDVDVIQPEPRFTINGNAGELITSIAVHMEKYEDPGDYDFLRYGHLKCFRITTNHGRMFQSKVNCNHPEMQVLNIAAGTTITGFYACSDAQFGFNGLGVISELL